MICIQFWHRRTKHDPSGVDPDELDGYGTEEKTEDESASGERDDTGGMEELRPEEGEVPKEIFVRGMSRNVKGSRGY